MFVIMINRVKMPYYNADFIRLTGREVVNQKM